MNPGDLNPWLQLINGALAVGAMVYAWIVSRRKDVEADFAKRDARIDALEALVREAAAKAHAAPPREELHSMALLVSEMRGDIRTMVAELRGSKDLMTRLENVVARHEEHLLKDRK